LDFTLLKPLLSFGGWMTVTNIVGPLMVNLDRLLVGSQISVTAVAYYATPYEVVTKLWIFPGAVVAVLFPKIAELLSTRSAAASYLYRRTVMAVFLTMLPPTALLALFSREGLTWWLSSDFAQESQFVAQCLTIAVFINCLAFVPHTTLQAGGKADWCAKVHLVELPLYLWLLISLAETSGINGVAIAWLVRVLIDAVTMFFLTNRLFGERSRFVLAVVCGSGMATAVLAVAVQGHVLWRISIAAIVTIISFTLLLRMLLVDKESDMVKR
jgi:O-antigen/teichoic acid export membrane protein